MKKFKGFGTFTSVLMPTENWQAFDIISDFHIAISSGNTEAITHLTKNNDRKAIYKDLLALKSDFHRAQRIVVDEISKTHPTLSKKLKNFNYAS